MILSAAVGLAIVVLILWESFETIILPRRVARRWRLTRLFYRSTWVPWRAAAHRMSPGRRRETFLSYFGPLSLLVLLGTWAVSLIFGFALLYGAAASLERLTFPFSARLYMSGTTFFTLGLGDVVPHGPYERALAVVESGIGFAFLAMLISYLPVIYSAFSRREVNIVLLDARAGSPPTVAEILRRHSGSHGLEALQQLLLDWEHWSADLLESHISYAVVSFYRSQHNNQSWLGALAAILDTSALIIAMTEGACARQAKLTFAMCRHAVVDLAQVFHAAPRAPDSDRLPPGEHERLLAALKQTGMSLRETRAAKEKLQELRSMYEPYLHALAGFLFIDLPPWILSREIADNWRTTAWGRISGFEATDAEEVHADDHSD